MPDYVGHIFALTLPKLQRPNPGADYCSPTTPNRWNSALPARLPGRPSNEDRRRAALQGPVNGERRKVGLGQEAVESAASRLRHQPAFREDGRGTNARLSRDASVVKLTMGFGEVLFRDLGPSAVTLGPASEGAASAKRRLLHDDKTGACSRRSTRRSATMTDMNLSALWTRLRPSKRSAKASASATSAAVAGVSFLAAHDPGRIVDLGEHNKNVSAGPDPGSTVPFDRCAICIRSPKALRGSEISPAPCAIRPWERT